MRKVQTRNRRILIFFGLLLAIGGGPIPSGIAATKFLTGKHQIIYDIVNPLGVEFLPNYSNRSYSQKVLQEDEFSKRVLIEIDLTRVLSTAPFPIPSQHLGGDLRNFLVPEKNIPVQEAAIRAKAQSLAQGARTVHEAVTAVFNWIVDHFTYDAARNTPQDGRSVFYSQRGSCVGFTHLSIAMLRSLNIPARYAHGYLPPGYDWGISKKYWGVQISGGGYHAWVEVYYPDIGWTFSDLLHSKDFVDPFHILRYIDGVNLNPRGIQGGSLDVEEATTYTIFKEQNTTFPIDQLQLPRKDILARPLGPQQYGTIHGLIRDATGNPIPKGQIVLRDGGQGRVIPFEKGLYAILGLESGNYRLTIRADGFGEMERNLPAIKGEVKNIDWTLPPPPSRPAASPPAAMPKPKVPAKGSQ
jgi:hypothetical protein